MNNLTLSLMLLIIWPFLEEKKMLENHTHKQFNLFAILYLLILKALQYHIFLFLVIIALLKSKDDQVLNCCRDVIFSSSM